MDTLRMLEEMQPPFSRLMGVKFLSADPEQMCAEMEVREDLCTRPAVLHGGAMMAMADTAWSMRHSDQPARGRGNDDD